MRNFAKTSYKKYLLAGATVLAMGAAPMVAHATPYAYGSNSITNLKLTYAGGASLDASQAKESVSDTASYGSINATPYGVTNNVGEGISAGQAYAGSGSLSNSSDYFAAIGPGNFTGARAASAIGAGSSTTGGITVNNAVEAYGNQFGQSTANNKATVYFTVTGTGQKVSVSFNDALNQIASTAAVAGETVNVGSQNTFQVYDQTTGQRVTNDSPASINYQTGSIGGADNTYTHTASYTLTTGVLTLNDVYNISLTSAVNETIIPGGTPVPEPGSLALLGTGLLGLALVARKRVRKG